MINESILFALQFDSSLLGNDSSEVEHERHRSAQLENELITLKIKYEDVCERVTAATLQLERVQVVLEQTLRRCDQLEKEKVCRSRLIGVIYIHFYLANLFFYDSTSSATQEIGIVCCYCCFSSPEIVDSSISLTHTHTHYSCTFATGWIISIVYF